MTRAPRTHAPELLAPAGGPQAFRAAINNGADAVYLGLGMLNARRGAENFTSQTLADACRYAHVRGRRVYLTANVLILPDEMQAALDLVDEAWSLGVDAVIVQDVGLMHAIRRSMPEVRVHASTQVNAHNTSTIEELARLGVSRVTLARETSLEEIARFVEHSNVEIESFVHGALCMCYSGQCLLSSLIGARSANRGMCAQPCRLAYELVDGEGKTLSAEGAHLLSPKDLAGVAMLPRFVAAGVAALKIEGRMKSPEYVALVTGVYRAALDRALTPGDAFEVREGELRVLEEAFSRGFTSAYLEGARDNEMMSYRRPNNRGVSVGRVVDAAEGRATIAFDTQVESDDVVEFWTGRGRFAQRVGDLGYAPGSHGSAPAGTRATVSVEQAVRPHDRVFRVANASLLAAARRTFEAGAVGRPVPLAFSVRAVRGAPLKVQVADAEGRSGVASGAVVEKARTKPLTAEDVIEHVGRLGSTPYAPSSWDVEISPGVGLGFSELHALRRQALEEYERRVLARWSTRRRTHPVAPPLRQRAVRRSKPGYRRPLLVASVEDPSLAEILLAAGVDEVHVPVDATGLAALTDDRIVPFVPRVLHDVEVARATRFLRPGRRVCVGNLGMLSAAKEAGAVIEAHWGLNAANAWTVEVLARIGAELVWLSPELSGRQIAGILGGSDISVGVGAYGRQEVMVTEHCILMGEGPCDQTCGTCARRLARRFLKDRKGYRFPVQTDLTGRSHLYNAVPLDLSATISELVGLGVGAFRMDLTVESQEEAQRIAGQLRGLLDSCAASATAGSAAGASSNRAPGASAGVAAATPFEGRAVGASAEPLVQPATTGHYFRGVK